MTAIPATRTDHALRALQGEIAPVRVRPLYRVGLLLVTVAMLLLPLIYVGLILGIGWLVVLHAQHDTGLLRGRGGIVRAVLYFGPIVVGAVGILFMIKPLFARRARESSGEPLDPAQHPRLFAYLAKLCRKVGAPVPAEVRVDLRVNASAGLRRGLLSLFADDLTLTIGLPLAAGLSLQQLTGVLAHELGHFRQGAGMRLQLLINLVGAWFARVVYERDAWDEKLEEAQREGGFWAIQLVVAAARAFVWLSRRVLWLLMVAGGAISSFMSRQMEYDADRIEARIAGSAAFEGTCLAMHELGLATSRAWEILERSWAEKRTCEDVVGLGVALRQRMPEELRRSLPGVLRIRRTGLFDSHPADGDRIDSALAENAPGLGPFEGPAAVLVSDLEGLCKEASAKAVGAALEVDLSKARVESVAEFLRSHDERVEQSKRLSRYGQETLTVYRPLPFDAVGEAGGADGVQVLEEARGLVLARSPALAEAYEKAFDRVKRLSRARALWAAQVFVDFEELGLEDLKDEEQLPGEVAKAEAALKGVLEPLAEIERATARRIAAAVRLLDEARVRAALPDAEALRQEAQQLLRTLEPLAPALAQMEGWRRDLAILDALLSAAEDSRSEALWQAIVNASEEVHGRFAAVYPPLERLAYPFDHADGSISVARYLAPGLPEARKVGEVYGLARQAGMRLGELHFRALSRLAAIGESVEGALGMAPLAPREEAPGARTAA